MLQGTKVDCKIYRSCMLGDFNIDLFSKSVLHKRSIASTKAYGFHQLMSVSIQDRYLKHFWSMFWLIVQIMFSSQGPCC